MISLTSKELQTYFPTLVKVIQANHNMKPIAEELFINNKATRGLCYIQNYFVEIKDDIYLQYVMEHVVIEPTLYLIARSLQRVILYSGKEEFELARVVDESNGKTRQNFKLN